MFNSFLSACQHCKPLFESPTTIRMLKIHQGRLTFLDVVVGQSASILELLARKDETLLVRGDSCK
jgi:hypothetical protein